ncbi:MAG: hypothetical protein LBT70_04500 [Holosporaceae bacterium]|jgi:cell division transport system permease protein|nr:hypothetical protein [Holosporaceae bacterium]
MMMPQIRDFDFDFYSDKTNRFVPFIIGFLMYSVTIAIMSCFFTCNLTSEWSNALNGHVTIEFQSNIDGPDESLTPTQIQEIIQMVESTEGIKSIKKLEDSDILKILEPWLSGTSIPDDFPFPTIFDVESDKNIPLDLLRLTEKLAKISPGVKIHDHSNWYTPILKISNGLFSFAILLSVLIFITVLTTVVFITKKTLSVHQNIVKILQLVGANDRYIAAQFNKYYFSVGCKASLMSIILGITTVFGMVYIFSGKLDFTTLVCVGIAITIPVFTTLLVMITARKSVVFFLNNDEWRIG